MRRSLLRSVPPVRRRRRQVREPEQSDRPHARPAAVRVGSGRGALGALDQVEAGRDVALDDDGTVGRDGDVPADHPSAGGRPVGAHHEVAHVVPVRQPCIGVGRTARRMVGQVVQLPAVQRCGETQFPVRRSIGATIPPEWPLSTRESGAIAIRRTAAHSSGSPARRAP